MALQLQELNTETDFPAIARCLFESYEDPPQNFFHVFFPIHGDGGKARQDAIDECAVRLKEWHTHDPSSYWQKVIDTETERIAGGALWNIHKENPFAEPHDSEVTWFPNDSSREYAAQAVESHSAPRARAAQKPHVYLFIIFTHPDYRRRGVAQQFLSWGMKKADELGFEIYLDSTPIGKPLYEANGFAYLDENVIKPQRDSPDEKWREIEQKVGSFTFWLMWRPVRGQYGIGKIV